MRHENMIESTFFQEMIQLTSNLYRLGWDERNGGNISYLLSKEEAVLMDGYKVKRVIPMSFDASALHGRSFLVTGSGVYFKNVASSPEKSLGLIRVSDDGTFLELLWGLEGDGMPTSELPTHLMSHIERLKKDSQHRVIIHCHATHLIAMTFTHPLDEEKLTKTLWQMCTECIVVFPEGVGVIPWMVPGTDAIGKATSAKMQAVRAVIWPHHGIFASGKDLDEAFGLIETMEKAAEVYTLTCVQGGMKQTITDDQLYELACTFNVEPREGILQCLSDR
ncbi:rhamnulose-1-phosphate aldolase [Bacillus sp. NPDC077027]|uniref:rhamnulose-1-phosphate aldolase n=1 Tax=Bacillus sp. NPDC077027 TaxID=3390548 RepID=UPI003D03C135